MGDVRRLSVPVAAVLVTLLLTGGIAAAGVMRSRPAPALGNAHALGRDVSGLEPDTTTTTTRTTLAPAASTTTVAVPPTTRPRPSTTVTTRPATTAATSPAAAGAPSGADGSPIRSTRKSFGPIDATGVEVPFAPGQASWSGVSNGITITVRVDNPSPRTGEAVGFDIEMSSAAHVCCGLVMWFGDGLGYEKDNGWACPGPTGHGPARYHTTHTYNLDGRWTFVVYPISGNCDEPMVIASLFAAVEVRAGTSAAQGPSLPVVQFDYSVPVTGHESDPSWLSVAGMADDADGWLRSFTVDWGDGSAPLVASQSVGPCQGTPSGWPAPTKLMIFSGGAFHHYDSSGAHVVTATAVSTSCDGSLPQQGSHSFIWRT